ncbi:TetR/AcrR family transcriptional regulator [Pararhodospirillum photometricum]|uniref:Transcriptional regulator, TetR family n=1 Tax=Pararhodospirillum photometricum DSM 122 TaxID=1150469 RepID=H6SRT7_PARPM|nr:TetR family transcriptional regulator [Pararhodospirillum photometricum]CCG07616.1 Transcriptional regulator, TetR family [Pararhodospirillum photometricum DSM 122]
MTTKERLIEAATREFADRGYHGATIQAIVYRAGANQAAVNYHFGNKAKLYEMVMRQAMARLIRFRDNPLADWLGAPDPLEALVRDLLSENLLPDGERALLHRLLAWEQLASSGIPGVQPVVMMDPHFRAVTALLAREVGCPADDPQVLVDAVWVIGQCNAFGRHNPLRSHLRPAPGNEERFFEETVALLVPRIRAGFALTRDPPRLAIPAE